MWYIYCPLFWGYLSHQMIPYNTLLLTRPRLAFYWRSLEESVGSISQTLKFLPTLDNYHMSYTQECKGKEHDLLTRLCFPSVQQPARV